MMAMPKLNTTRSTHTRRTTVESMPRYSPMPPQMPAIMRSFLLLRSFLPLNDFVIFAPPDFEKMKYNKAPTRFNKSMTMSQKALWAAFRRDVRQWIMAHTHTAITKITSKKTNARIHNGKKIMLNTILQDNIGL